METANACPHAPPGESFFIGDEIEIVILETGSHVRVSISAPRDVEIVRTELIPVAELELVDPTQSR
jgi:carbon storage regulator CsrA